MWNPLEATDEICTEAVAVPIGTMEADARCPGGPRGGRLNSSGRRGHQQRHKKSRVSPEFLQR